jgi:Dynamin family.
LKDCSSKNRARLTSETKKRKDKNNTNPVDTDQLKSRVARELDKSEPCLSASHDQYQRILKSGIDIKSIEESKQIEFKSIESLGNELADYVGSDGRFMPFTKSVHIRLPQENLKNIQIVDTPGVNDPVVSREERTRKLLKFCDVVFIVSPAGQFMSSEDLELMDRITSKEGVRELFVIASKCDTQLYGSVKQNSGGDLHRAFGAITTDLASSLYSTLSNLKKSNPEIGDSYDKLINQSKDSIIHSSGISHTIKETYNNQDVLDSGEAHAWNNLVEHYPDYFSKSDKKLTIPNLDLLSNMEAINKVIEDIRRQKDQILAKRTEEFLKAKTDSFAKYKNELLKFIEQSIEEVNSGDIEELKTKRKRLNHIKTNVSDLVDEEYHDLVDHLKIEMNSQLKAELDSYFKASKKDIESAEGTRSYKQYVGRGGFLWLTKKYETRHEATVRTGAVKSSLSDLTGEIENGIENVSNTKILAWRKSLAPALLSVLRDHVDDEDLNPSQIRKVVRNVINHLEFPLLSYSNISLPSGSGTLTGSSAENFIEEAKVYISSFKSRVNKDIQSYLTDLMGKLNNLELSKEIFSEYDSQLEELEIQIKNKAISLEEYGRCKRAIEEII